MLVEDEQQPAPRDTARSQQCLLVHHLLQVCKASCPQGKVVCTSVFHITFRLGMSLTKTMGTGNEKLRIEHDLICAGSKRPSQESSSLSMTSELQKLRGCDSRQLWKNGVEFSGLPHLELCSAAHMPYIY